MNTAFDSSPQFPPKGEADSGAQRPAAAPEGAPVSNTAPHTYQSGPISRILWQAIDSLYLSYRGEINPTWRERLDDLKARAQSEDEGERATAQAKIGEHVFEVHDKGQGRYAWILEDNAFRIQVGRGESLPLAYVQIRSDFLANSGAEPAVESLGYIVRTLGLVKGEPTVSRIDLCADFQSSLPMDSWRHDAWVTRAHSVEPHYQSRKFTGWSIGRGGVMSARLYNKLLEILTKKKGDHIFEPWQEAGWDIEIPVWRIEAQFRRDVLKELGIESFAQADANLDGLWRYFSEDWLRLTIPDGVDENRSRWPLHPLWESLASVNWGRASRSRLRRFRRERIPEDARLLVPGAGYVLAFMAKHDIQHWHRGVTEFGLAFQNFTNQAKAHEGTTFAKVVNDRVALKRRKYNTAHNAHGTAEERAAIEAQAKAYRQAKAGDEDAGSS